MGDLQLLLNGCLLEVNFLCTLQIIKCFDMIDQRLFSFAFLVWKTIIFGVVIIVLVPMDHILNIDIDRDTMGFRQVVVLLIGFKMKLGIDLADL